jgi:hypothetical protein
MRAIALARAALRRAYDDLQTVQMDTIQQLGNMIRVSLALASDKSNLERKLHLEETEAENVRQTFQARLREMESEKGKIQREHIAFVRQQQEASFRRMESARWLPAEDQEITRKLASLKANMRRWAREISIKDLSLLLSLERTEYDALVKDLAHVTLLENNQLPQVLFTAARSPMLLLSALLAQSVYSSFFQSPFFVYEEGGRAALESTYRSVQSGKTAFTNSSAFANCSSRPKRRRTVALRHIETAHASTTIQYFRSRETAAKQDRGLNCASC